ncbi:MAG: hypothetical protein HYW33_01420 [Candidatus Blackburnbacteria bacterium]|nr:hypothetical protein [Candidatus Blackburnbacteria bacterium]
MNTKRAVVFIGSFLATALAGTILFAGLMSQMPNEVNSAFFSNFFLSITVFFWILVGIPTLVAYLLTFKHFQTGTVPANSKKVLWSVGLVLFCAVLLAGVGRFFLKVRWEPYSLQSVSEEELAPPSARNNGVVIEKEVGEIAYQLRREGYKSEGLRLYKYNKTEDRVETVDAPTLFQSPEGNGVTDFWYDETKKNLWTIERAPLSSYLFLYQNPSGIEGKGATISKKLLANVASGFYSGSKILGFIDSTGELLLDTGFGDGCGGGGTVWAVAATGVRRDIQQYESGCANRGKLPDFVGVYKGSLIFASYEKTGDDLNLKLIRLYFSNPESGVQETLLTSKELPENIGYADFSGENKNVVVLSTAVGSENKSYNFDLTSKKIMK